MGWLKTNDKGNREGDGEDAEEDGAFAGGVSIEEPGDGEHHDRQGGEDGLDQGGGIGFEGDHEGENPGNGTQKGGKRQPAEGMALDAAVGDEVGGAVVDFAAAKMPEPEPEENAGGTGGAAEQGGHPGTEADTGIGGLGESEAADGGGTALPEGGEQGGKDAGAEFGGGEMLAFFGGDGQYDTKEHGGADGEIPQFDGGAQEKPFDGHGGGGREAGDGEYADPGAQPAVHGKEGNVPEGEVQKSGEGEQDRAGGQTQDTEGGGDAGEDQ